MTECIEQILIFRIARHVRIDKRGNGQITFGEFEEFFRDEAVKAFFESLQIGAMDAWTLFVSLVSWIAQGTIYCIMSENILRTDSRIAMPWSAFDDRSKFRSQTSDNMDR